MSDEKIRLPNINQVMLSGRLVADPETKFTQSGTQLATFRIAVDTPRKTKEGEWENETLFIKVKTFAYLAEKIQSQVKKGTPVIVEGRLRSYKYTPPDGAEGIYYEIVGRRVSPMTWISSGGQETMSNVENKTEKDFNNIDEEDEIPF